MKPSTVINKYRYFCSRCGTLVVEELCHNSESVNELNPVCEECRRKEDVSG